MNVEAEECAAADGDFAAGGSEAEGSEVGGFGVGKRNLTFIVHQLHLAIARRESASCIMILHRQVEQLIVLRVDLCNSSKSSSCFNSSLRTNPCLKE